MSFQDELFLAEQMLDENRETTVCFGEQAAIADFEIQLDSLCDGTILLCGGGKHSLYQSGAFQSVMRALCYHPLNVPRFENIPAEPDTDCVRKLTETMKQEKPDVVLAVGGGSVMDAAKAACLSWQTGMDVKGLFGSGVASSKFPGKQWKRVWCMPTTAGTGSEVTPYSNIIDAETGVKCLIADPAILPEYAFVEPSFTTHIPADITRDTALDAFVHCAESLLNVKAAEKHPEAAGWAIHGISLIEKALPCVLKKDPESLEMRMLLSAAATLGGMCIAKCPTSLPHLCSFSFCGKSTHGAAVAALLPHFWRFYLKDPAVRERTLRLGNIFHGRTPEEIVNAVEAFFKSVGAETNPGRLTGTEKSFIDRLAKDAVRNPMKLTSAPVPVDPESAGAIFHQVLDPVWSH